MVYKFISLNSLTMMSNETKPVFIYFSVQVSRDKFHPNVLPSTGTCY